MKCAHTPHRPQNDEWSYRRRRAGYSAQPISRYLLWLTKAMPQHFTSSLLTVKCRAKSQRLHAIFVADEKGRLLIGISSLGDYHYRIARKISHILRYRTVAGGRRLSVPGQNFTKRGLWSAWKNLRRVKWQPVRYKIKMPLGSTN
jgi:hypothetical protein